jgi:hypothetical protein
MAANTINVGVNVSDNGTVAQLQAKLKAASSDLASLKNVMRQTSGGMAGMGGPTKQENIDYRNARGVAGTGGGGSRDFAKQAQGLGGLVRLYATFAANIFAVSAAFTALDRAAQFEQMIQGAKALEASTGAALRSIADQMKNVTDGALSMQESMRLTALGSAAGLSQKMILELTKGAKGASLALGRDMADSIDRVIRGVAKLEPELLDELGVVTRAQEAYKNYAKNLNISTDALTSYQKTMAYSTAVAKELGDKFGDVNEQVDANPYAKFLGQLKDVGTQLLTLVNNVVTPVIETITNNIELMYVGVLLLVKRLTLTALPEITKLFTVSPAVLTARKAQSEALIAEIKASSDAEIAIAQEKQRKLIKIEEENLIAANNLKRQTLAQNKSRAFADPSSPTAEAVNRVAAGTQVELSSRQLGALKGNVTRATNDLKTAISSGKASSEQIANLTARQEAATKVLAASVGIKSQIATVDAKILGITQQMNVIESEILAKQKLQTTNSQAQIDLAKNRLAVLKMERNQLIESANYTDPTGRAGKAVAASQDAAIRAARLASIATNPKNIGQQAVGPNGVVIPALEGVGGNLTTAGKRALMFGSALDTISIAASAAGKALGKLVGFLGGPWVIGAMIAWEVLSFGADKLGLLNKKNDEFNKSLEEGTKVLETASSAYFKYTVATTLGAASSTSLIQANTIVANTFDQVNDSIAATLTAFTEYENAQTGFSKFLDKILPGKSKFEEVKALVSGELAAASALATGFDKLQLESMSKRVTNTIEEDGIAALNRVQEESASILQRVSEAKKVESSRIQDLSKKYGDAANAVENFNKKQIIKNADLRIIDETLVALSKFMSSTATESAKLQMLASLPEEIAKLDKVLAQSRQNAVEEIASRRNLAEAQVKILKEQKVQEDYYKLSRTELNLLEASSSEELLARKQAFQKDSSNLEDLSLNLRFMKESKYIEERLAKESSAKIALEKATTEQRLKDDEVRNKTLKNLGYDMGKEMVTGWLDNLPEWLLNIFNKTKTSTAPGAKIAADNAVLASKGQLPADNIGMANTTGGVTKARQDFGTKTNDLPKNAAITAEEEAAAIERARVANAAKERSNMLDRLAKENALKLLKAQGEQLALNNKIEERTSGFLSQQSITKEFANKKEQEAVQYSLNLLDIDTKTLANDKKKGLEADKTAKLLSDATAAVNLNYEVKLRTLNLEEKEKTVAAGMAEYNLKSVSLMKENLVVGQDALALKVLTGQISAEDALTQENVLSLVNNTIDRETILTQAKLDGYTNEAQFLGTIYEIKLRTNMAEAKHIEEMNRQKAIAFKRSQAQLELDNQKAALDIKIGEATKSTGSASVAQMQEQFLLRQLQLQQDITVAGGNALLVEQAKLKAQADFIALLEQELVVRKRNFASLSGTDQAQTVYDEAVKRARDFQSNMKDTVTGVFDAVYSGMDAAIDSITTKMMNGTKITFKEISDLFRNTVAEGFREMAAEQLKSSARNVIKDIMGAVLPGVNLDTNEEKALSYAEKSMNYLEIIAYNTGGGAADSAKGVAGMFGFGKDAPGMEGQTAFAALPLSVKLDSNTGFNMNSTQDNLDNAASAAEYFSTATDEAGNSLSALGDSVPSIFSGISDSFGSLFGGDGIVMNLLSGLGSGIGGIFDSIMGMFSGAGGGGFDIGGLISGGLDFLSSFSFANGGVMSEYGPLKLNKYASGGIANSPQMAIYGEGRMNEAYVPLPDGRTIPVTMQGNTGGGSGPVSIVVNVDAKGNTDTQATGTTNAQDAKQLGMIISSKVREEIVNQQRSGGLLNKR